MPLSVLMPTPNASGNVASALAIPHSSCPPETDGSWSHQTNNTPAILRVNSPETSDKSSDEDTQICSKIIPEGSEDDAIQIEHSSGAITRVQSAAKPCYRTRDLGFALTAEYATTLSDPYVSRKRASYPTSFLQPGSKFVGTQTDKKIYNVEVEIKEVDMQQSGVCGYLKIDGLTDEFPSLTTFFDGEVIGPHFSFITKHPDWGASEKTDMAYWDKFPAFRPLSKQARNPEFHPKNISQKENIFMRWKERFIVSNHKISEIQGASYEGFYYICLNQVKGTISGVYFHAKSDRYQSLDLKHVPQRGCLAALEWA